MSGTSPTARGMKMLREFGYQGEIVEVFVKHSGTAFGYKKDVLGLFDAIVFTRKQSDLGMGTDVFECLGAQFCSVSGISSHKRKAINSPWLEPWLKSGNKFVIYGFWPWSNEDRRDEHVVVEATINDAGRAGFIKS